MNLFYNMLLVGLGGALGAIGRYFISLIPNRMEFPILTLITNVLGAILIGFIVGYNKKNGTSDYAMLFWKTGVCGGFTTFSTFSLEASTLIDKELYLQAAIYVILSLVLCFIGIYIGQKLANI